MRYIVKKIGMLIVTLLLVSVLAFLAARHERDA